MNATVQMVDMNKRDRRLFFSCELFVGKCGYKSLCVMCCMREERGLLLLYLELTVDCIYCKVRCMLVVGKRCAFVLYTILVLSVENYDVLLATYMAGMPVSCWKLRDICLKDLAVSNC